MLYQQGLTENLITTGRSVTEKGADRLLSKETSEIWTGLGIPAESIVEVSEPRNTSEELAAVATLGRETSGLGSHWAEQLRLASETSDEGSGSRWSGCDSCSQRFSLSTDVVFPDVFDSAGKRISGRPGSTVGVPGNAVVRKSAFLVCSSL